MQNLSTSIRTKDVIYLNLRKAGRFFCTWFYSIIRFSHILYKEGTCWIFGQTWHTIYTRKTLRNSEIGFSIFIVSLLFFWVWKLERENRKQRKIEIFGLLFFSIFYWFSPCCWDFWIEVWSCCIGFSDAVFLLLLLPSFQRSIFFFIVYSADKGTHLWTHMFELGIIKCSSVIFQAFMVSLVMWCFRFHVKGCKCLSEWNWNLLDLIILLLPFNFSKAYAISVRSCSNIPDYFEHEF